MSLKIFLSTVPQHAHERASIKQFVEQLENYYKDSTSFCYIFIHYQCDNREIDATLIREDAIINIEFKSYSATTITATAQGDLILEPSKKQLSIEQGGETPLSRIKEHNYAINRVIQDLPKDVMAASGVGLAAMVDVCGFYLFNNYDKLDLTTFPWKLKAFFQITKLSEAIRDLNRYHGRDPLRGKYPLKLNEIFIESLAKKLALSPVANAKELFSSVKNDLPEEIQKYLKTALLEWKVQDYVRRPDIEIKLLNDKSHILFGAPGAGKSSLLKEMLRHQAEQLKNVFTRIPVLLENLVGDEDIVEKISGELGIVENEQTKQFLADGSLWLAFDGVDEIVQFKKNILYIINFIKRYPQNRYSISVRRETFENDSYKSIFMPLKHFEKIEVGEFSPEERITFLRYRMKEQLTDEQLQIFEEFSKSLPDANPLTQQMALEIFKESGELIYENMGLFYQKYFQVYLKREVELSKELDKGTELLLHSILANLGKHSFNNDSNLIPIKDIYAYIKETVNEKITYIYNLLLRSEILKETPVIVPTGQDQKREVWVKFFHQSYRDYYTAEGLSGKLTEFESIENLFAKENEDFMITLLCGIETQRSIVDALILTAISNNLRDLAIDCFCNTRNISAKTRNGLKNYLKEIIDDGEIGSSFHYLNKYKARIALLLIEPTDAQLESHLLRRIDWEYEKYKVLDIKPEEKYSETLRFKHLIENISIFPLTELTTIRECQNASGAKLYDLLKQDGSCKSVFSLIRSGKYDQAVIDVLKSHLFFHGVNGEIKNKDKEVIEYLDTTLTNNIIREIAWNFYKSHWLGYPLPPEGIVKTPLYQYLIDNPGFCGHPTCGSVLDWEECQTELGLTFYRKLTKATTENELFNLLTDNAFPLECRAFVLQRLDREYEDILDNVLNRLKGHGILFTDGSELFSWMTIQIVFNAMAEVYDDINTENYPLFLKDIQNQLTEVFWTSSLHTINLRIAYNILTLGDIALSLEFAHKLLREYDESQLVDVQRIKHLTDLDHIMNEFSFANNDFELVMDYSLDDFANENYSTLLKCFALERVSKSDSFEDVILLQNFAKSENPKLQRLSKYYLKKKTGKYEY